MNCISVFYLQLQYDNDQRIKNDSNVYFLHSMSRKKVQELKGTRPSKAKTIIVMR